MPGSFFLLGSTHLCLRVTGLRHRHSVFVEDPPEISAHFSSACSGSIRLSCIRLDFFFAQSIIRVRLAYSKMRVKLIRLRKDTKETYSVSQKHNKYTSIHDTFIHTEVHRDSLGPFLHLPQSGSKQLSLLVIDWHSCHFPIQGPGWAPLSTHGCVVIRLWLTKTLSDVCDTVFHNFKEALHINQVNGVSLMMGFSFDGNPSWKPHHHQPCF